MELYLPLFATLVSLAIATWFAAHAVAVAKNGGPAGDGYEKFAQTKSVWKFRFYLAVQITFFVIYGIGAILGALSIWRDIWK